MFSYRFLFLDPPRYSHYGVEIEYVITSIFTRGYSWVLAYALILGMIVRLSLWG